MNVFSVDSENFGEVFDELDRYTVNSSGEFLNKNYHMLNFKDMGDFNQKINEVFNSYIPTFLMEDHSITLHIIKLLNSLKDDLGVIIFDAHPDCDVDYNYNFFGRQKDILISLIESGIDPKKIILVGVRKFTQGEYNFLKHHKIRFFDMDKIISLGLVEFSLLLMENARMFKSFYLSIDLDVFDPAFVDVNFGESGGLSARDGLFLIKRLCRLKNISGIDLSEFNVTSEKSVKVVAKIISECV